MPNLNLEIDGRKVQVAPGSTVMDAANALDIYVPHFCYHRKLSIAANCRCAWSRSRRRRSRCRVRDAGLREGMKVWTQSEQAKKAQNGRDGVPADQPSARLPDLRPGRRVQLQDLAVGYGGSASRYTRPKRVVFHKNLGAAGFAAEEMTRCIQCTRCVALRPGDRRRAGARHDRPRRARGDRRVSSVRA
jgi:NADH-quinone oxidoreductase subunit G